MSDDSTNLRQEFVTELESILESDEAYGSNLQILIYALKEDVINGKFKDSWNNRVYEFIIDIDGISYKPAAKLDSFGADELPTRFDAYSKGYASLFKSVRFDRNPIGKRVKKPKCGKQGYGCGYSCISLLKTCQILSSGKKAGTNQGKAIGQQRLNKLMELSEKLYLAGDTKKAALASTIAGNISKVRTKYNAGGQGLIAERTLAKQQATAKNPELVESAKSKVESAKNTTIPIDKSLFDIKFPQKVQGASDSYESLIDRVNQAQNMAKGKDPYFVDANPGHKGRILRDMVQEYYGADIDYDVKLKDAIRTGSKSQELYSRAAITRLQAARQLWEDLPEKQKRIVARTLKYEEQDPSLLTQKEEVKNPYINELRKEFAKYIAFKPKKSN